MSEVQQDNGGISDHHKTQIEIAATEPEKLSGCAWLMKQSHLDLLTVFLAETIGTGMLVLLGCMGCISIGDHVPSHLSITLAFGLAVMLILNIFAMVSGAHLNPAVSIAAVIYKLISIPTAIVYSIGQILGGYLGYGLLRALVPQEGDSRDNFCVSKPGPGVTPARAFLGEFIISAVLILVCCGVWDPRNSKHHDSVPLRFGLTITILALVGGPISGGSMNPARSFGPALYTGNWEWQWLYWAAPISAGVIIAFIFRMIFYREPVKEIRAIEELPLREHKNNV